MNIRPQITHLGLYTGNLEGMIRFYSDVMGLMVTDRGRVPRLNNIEVVFMSANPANHHQLVLFESEKRESNVQQMSFKIGTLTELRAMRDRLVGAGAPISPIDHGNAWSVYSSDPDGNGVEIYLDTPWQVAQPHGRPLDLALSDEAILKHTQAAIENEKTYQPRERWAEQFIARLR
jgi:catechol 2,3-dioxygenase